MAGVSIRISSSGFEETINRMDGIFDFDPAGLMSAVGALGESQTRRRITDEKTSPDGAAWPPNREGGSILHRTGRNLLDSVAHVSSSDEAEWGASWEHAHVHQEGAVIVPKSASNLVFNLGGQQIFAKKVTIPARPFVGLSAENQAEMRELVTDFIGLGLQ